MFIFVYTDIFVHFYIGILKNFAYLFNYLNAQ